MKILVNDGFQTCDCCGYNFKTGQTVVECTEGYFHCHCYKETYDISPDESDLCKVVAEDQ